MSYSLSDFCEDVRATLAGGDSPESRETVRQKLERLLVDPAFCTSYVGPDADPGMQEIYQDSDLDFCVLAYNMTDPRTSPPHDHGSSWAVYGQTAGHTDMTLWAAQGKAAGDIKPIRSFRLNPGQAGLFDVGEIHSIDYPAGSKFVRVTGVDMNKEARRVFDPEQGTVKVIERVGTGRA